MSKFKVGDVVVVHEKGGFYGEDWDTGALGMIMGLYRDTKCAVNILGESDDDFGYRYEESNLTKIGVL